MEHEAMGAAAVEAAAAGAAAAGLGGRLDAIRGEAAEGGVSVVVDLHGKPVGLDFDREALRMRPDDLAALVRRLAERAAESALAQGMAVLADVVPEGSLASLAPAAGSPAVNPPAANPPARGSRQWATR